MSFQVVFHTENCAVHSENPTVSPVYLATPRWHHLKALNSFNRWASHDIFLFKYHFLFHILRLLVFFSDNIMADVASKQKTTALLLSTIVTRTRRHTELTNLMANLCCARENSFQFFVQFFLHSWTAQFNLGCMGPLKLFRNVRKLKEHYTHSRWTVTAEQLSGFDQWTIGQSKDRSKIHPTCVWRQHRDEVSASGFRATIQ